MKKTSIFLSLLLAGGMTFAGCSNESPENDSVTPGTETPGNDDKDDEEPSIALESIAPDQTGMTTPVFEIAKEMKAGFNIGNTLECPGGENDWGNPNITQELLNAIKQAGFGAVRLPVGWNFHAKDGVIDEAWLDRVQEVVDYAMNAGLYAIVNDHWDGGWLENTIPNGYSQEVDSLQYKYWKQIAIRFRDYGEKLIFAGCNEPNVDNSSQMATLETYEQTFVNAVRNTGGKNYYRVLVIQGPSTDVDKTSTLFKSMPKDVAENRLMAEVHYYSPYNFCLMPTDESWGKCFYFWGDANKSAAQSLGMYARWSNWGGDAYLRAQMGKMKSQFVSMGIPVILGEYGALMERDKELAGNQTAIDLNHKSIGDFNEAVTREAINAGIVPFLWDTGAAIDRTTCEILKSNLIPAVIKGANAGTYPY